MKPPAWGEWRCDTVDVVTLLCAVSVSHGGNTNQEEFARIVYFIIFPTLNLFIYLFLARRDSGTCHGVGAAGGLSVTAALCFNHRRAARRAADG